MINRFQRMLNPYAGFLGGGGGSSGGGGGGGGSTVSDAEFEGAIRQDTANKASGGGGVSYGDSGYVGSGGSSADSGGQPAPITYTAKDGSIHTTATDRDTKNAQIDAAAYADNLVTSALTGTNYDPTAWNDYALGVGKDDSLFGDTVSASKDYATALEKVGAAPEQLDIVEVGSIADKGLFDWLTDNITGNEDSDVAKASGAGDYLPDLLTGSQFKVDEASGALVRQTGTGDQNLDIGMYLDYNNLSSQYDPEDFQDLWTDETLEVYADNSLGFQELVKDKETLEQAVTGASVGKVLDTITFGLTDFTPKVQMLDNGILGVNDPLSLKGIAYNTLDTIVNTIGSYAAGGVVGDILFGATGEIPTAVMGAKGTEQIVKYLEPLDNQVYLGIDGKTYLSTSIFGGEADMVALEDAVNNVNTAKQTANQAIADSGGSSDSFNMQESLKTGISGARDAGVSGSNWRDYYDLDFNAKEIIAGTLGDAFAVDPEVYKAAEMAAKLSSGEDIVDAAIQTYGDKLVDFLPEGYEQPTEAAIRIASGEDRVNVLGDVYGQDLGLDNPLGKASVDSLNTYDQTGDTNKAIVDGFVTYVKEGGELPEFEVPEYISSNLDFDIPDVDFGGISFGDLPDVNLPDMIDLNINLGSIDFGDIPALDLGIDLGELPDVPNMDIASLDWSGVDVTLPEVDLGALKAKGVDVGSMDWSGTNIGKLGDIDIADLNLDFGELDSLAKGTTTIASVGASKDLLEGDSDLFGDAPEINRLSQKLLNAKLV